MKDIRAELEDICEFNSQSHREAVKLAFKQSVPFGGISTKEIPTVLMPFFDELIKKGYLVVKQVNKDLNVVCTTMRAVFILSSREHTECVGHVDRAWRDYEAQSNVRCAILGPFHILHNTPKKKK
jgi:hypothetical protein